MIFTSSYISETGPRRENEDAVEVWTSKKGVLFVAVADGLGGMGGGSTASSLAISTLRDVLESTDADIDSLINAAKEAHDRICRAQQEGVDLQKMATTLTVLAFSEGRILGVHTGDTRAAIARRNGIKRLTKDHSEGQRLFDAGKLSKEELRTYQRQHILESALGDESDPIISPIKFDLEIGDKVVITSDGVHGIIFLKEMRDMLADAFDVDEFVGLVGRRVRDRGPKDNYSIAAVFVE